MKVYIFCELRFTAWKEVKALAAARGLRSTRRSGNEAAQAHKALQLASLDQHCVAVLLMRDLDNRPQRRDQLLEERDRHPERSFAIVFATPDPELEAWVLHGFDPVSDEERRVLSQLMIELGFDPRLEPNRLRGDLRRGPDERDIKLVLRQVTSGSFERRESCFCETPLPLLAERGQATHLAAFLNEIESELLPRLTGQESTELR